MQSQENKTRMVAPQESSNMTKAIFIAKDPTEVPEEKKAVTQGMVRIQAIRAISDGEQSYAEGCVLDVTPEFAKEFCDRVFEGYPTHVGEVLATNAQRHKIVRAIRLS